MKKRILMAALIFSLACGTVLAAPGGLSFEASGGAALPLGGDADLFGTSLGGLVGAGLLVSPSLPLEAKASLGYSSAAVNNSGGVSLSIIRLSLGAGFKAFSLGPLGIDISAALGGYYAFLSDGSAPAFNPLLEGGIGLSFGQGAIRPFIRALYASELGLSQELVFRAGVVFHPGQSGPAEPKASPKAQAKPATKPGTTTMPAVKPLVMKTGPSGFQVIGLELDPVFPVFFRYYESNPIGWLVVKNAGSTPIDAIQADLLVKQFMDDPKASSFAQALAPGAEARIPLFALFTDSILGVSEGSKVSGSIAISYNAKGKRERLDLTTAFTLYDRNATTWSDDRRAAAFVTAKDPLVLKFSKNLAGFIDDAKRYGLPKSFAAGMGVFESLRRYGMRYAIDPTASYEAASKAENSVDFIQFPRQTLDFKAGDCDDLSVLTAALLESLGAKSAFITVPGHIFVAVDLELSPDEARKRFTADALILQGSHAWLPIEITALQDDFLKAWDLGAREWREAAAKGLAAIYPIADAWLVYAPVGFVSESAQAQPPESAAVAADCLKEMERYIQKAIAPAIAKVEADMKKSGRSPSLLNHLAVIYAAAGLRSTARDILKEAIAKEEFAPALLNLGNIAFLEKDFAGALAYYERAYKRNAQDPKTLLAVARANHELENYGQARDYYARLKKIDAALAAQFSYIELRGEEAGRAADAAGVKEKIVWSE